MTLLFRFVLMNLFFACLSMSYSYYISISTNRIAMPYVEWIICIIYDFSYNLSHLERRRSQAKRYEFHGMSFLSFFSLLPNKNREFYDEAPDFKKGLSQIIKIFVYLDNFRISLLLKSIYLCLCVCVTKQDV